MNSTIKFENIIWDWNGTLLDDIGICIESMNILLSERELPLLYPEYYRDVFTFPVREYYALIGFDFSKEPFSKVGLDFMEIYKKNLPKSKLQKEALATLDFFSKSGYKQYVLSAMEQKSLNISLSQFGITNFFEGTYGLSDEYAEGKISLGKMMVEKSKIDPAKTLLIGDTIHDAEVAEALGFSCILIAQGHQNHKRLEKSNLLVLDNLQDLVKAV